MKRNLIHSLLIAAILSMLVGCDGMNPLDDFTPEQKRTALEAVNDDITAITNELEQLPEDDIARKALLNKLRDSEKIREVIFASLTRDEEGQPLSENVKTTGQAAAPYAGPYAGIVLLGTTILAGVARQWEARKLKRAESAIAAVEVAKQLNGGSEVNFSDEKTKKVMAMVAGDGGKAAVKRVQAKTGKATTIVNASAN